jgi:hypothetical protein
VVPETTCDSVTDNEFIQEPLPTDKAVNLPISCTERIPPIRVVERIEIFEPNLEGPATEKEDPAACHPVTDILDPKTRALFTDGTYNLEDTERSPMMIESDMNAAPSSIETKPVIKASRAISSESPTCALP